ncbi:hypothetical protein H1R20_g2935, partial [Candolleomyces eurysporus]
MLIHDRSNIDDATSASTSTFVTALVFNAIVFGAQIGIFTLLRPRFKAIYEPRTYVGINHVKPLTPKPKSIAVNSKNARSFGNSLLWPVALINADFREIIKYNGLDAYFFVRYLRMMLKIFVPIWILSWAILLPITTVNTGDPVAVAKDGLVQFTFGNVSVDDQPRYWAHLVCVWVFTLYILYILRGEMSHFLITRQQHLIEKKHSQSVQAKTILVTGIPPRYLTQRALYALFNELPGGVHKIWINRNLKELPDIYDRRMAACNKLESAEVTLMRTAIKLKQAEAKAAKKGKVTSKDSEADTSSLVPKESRPTHKTGFLGLFGPKVDTIEWCREEIATCNKLLDEGRAEIAASEQLTDGEFSLLSDNDLRGGAVDENGNPISKKRADTWKDVDGDGEADVLNGAGSKVAHGAVGGVKGVATTVKGALRKGAGGEDKYPALNSAFITFNKQIAAHLAVQSLAHHMPYTMSSRYIEVAPSDVIHTNLNLNPYEQKIRLAVSYAATAGLILLWAFPVAFVGVVSNIHTVCAEVSFLAWICDLNEVIVGLISGILPPVLLAVLMMLLPIVLRLLARFEGIPKYTGLELSLMTRFFLFQVLHSFLIVTLASGVIASLPKLLNNPTSIPSILAENLPKSSTFFLTYIVLQGLAATAGGFLQIVRLIVYYVKLVLLGSTPRSIYGIKYSPGDVAWGTLFPSITLLTVISLAYSIISPIINGLAVLAFFLFFQLYKYLFLWVLEQDQRRDTGGLFFPKAIQHVLVGLYLQQICLAALFFLARNADEKATSVPQGALMVVLIVVTAGFHAILNNSYRPLIVALPLSLKDRLGRGVSVEETKTDVDDVDETQAKDRPERKSGEIVRKTVNTPAELEAGIQEERREGGAVAIDRTGNTSEDAQKRDKAIADEKEDLERNEVEEYGFAHPATSRPQRTVWIPHFTTQDLPDPEASEKEQDKKVDEETADFIATLKGMSVREAQACREAGVDAREDGAKMDGKGKILVSAPPPGYAGL